MKQIITVFLFFTHLFTLLALENAKAQIIDTLVNVGGYALHFKLIKGHGTPIVFEAGGGDDASAWDGILAPVASITGATVVAYDRPGFGKSGLDTNQHGIIKIVEGLEAGLQKLGCSGSIMCVAHSQD